MAKKIDDDIALECSCAYYGLDQKEFIAGLEKTAVELAKKLSVQEERNVSPVEFSQGPRFKQNIIKTADKFGKNGQDFYACGAEFKGILVEGLMKRKDVLRLAEEKIHPNRTVYLRIILNHAGIPLEEAMQSIIDAARFVDYPSFEIKQPTEFGRPVSIPSSLDDAPKELDGFKYMAMSYSMLRHQVPRLRGTFDEYTMLASKHGTPTVEDFVKTFKAGSLKEATAKLEIAQTMGLKPRRVSLMIRRGIVSKRMEDYLTISNLMRKTRPKPNLKELADLYKQGLGVQQIGLFYSFRKRLPREHLLPLLSWATRRSVSNPEWLELISKTALEMHKRDENITPHEVAQSLSTFADYRQRFGEHAEERIYAKNKDAYYAALALKTRNKPLFQEITRHLIERRD